MVAEAPEPSVMEAPGVRVWPKMMYWDWAFGAMVSLSMVIGTGALAGGAGKLRGEVVRI